MKKKFLIVLSLIVIVSTAIYFFFFRIDFTTLADRLEYPERGWPVEKNVSIYYSDNDWMQEFRKGKFEESFLLLQSLLKEKKQNDTLMYFAGVCLYKTGNYKAAINYFFKLAIDKPFSEYNERSRYYIGLIHLKRSRKKEAKEIYKSLRQSTNIEIRSRSEEMLKYL